MQKIIVQFPLELPPQSLVAALTSAGKDLKEGYPDIECKATFIGQKEDANDYEIEANDALAFWVLSAVGHSLMMNLEVPGE